MKMIAGVIAMAGMLAIAAETAERTAGHEESRQFAERLKKMPPEERKAAIAEIRMRKVGGFIIKTSVQKGRILFVNAQRTVSAETFAMPLENLRLAFGVKVDFETLESAPTVGDAEAWKVASDSEVCVFVVDDASLPMSIVAPESHWAYLNVHELVANGIKSDSLAKRVSQATWRVFGNLCGASDSQYPGCIMSPVRSVRDLDTLSAYVFSPEPGRKIENHLRKIGITPSVRTTYKKACEEGWAPAPTNEYQKAIWEKAKADKERGPTNPITIKPPSKK